MEQEVAASLLKEESFDDYDGYERLHDEAMDNISVSIHSDCSNIDRLLLNSMRNSKSNFTLTDGENREEKKMKISLSQEQLKLNVNNKNFLTVPVKAKKYRVASFSSEHCKSENIFTPQVNGLSISKDLLRITRDNGVRMEQNVEEKLTSYDDVIVCENINEIIYAVPQKQNLPSIKTSSASSLLPPSISFASATTSTSNINVIGGTVVDMKYSSTFYCKICNNILNDPRILNCLHSFCCSCLAQLDASNNLQSNEFWRKMSDSSSCMYNRIYPCLLRTKKLPSVKN
jgi:hypothetical protein